jgi:basic membrane protein A and related proteins
MTRYVPFLLLQFCSVFLSVLPLAHASYATDKPSVAEYKPAIIYEFSGNGGDQGFVDLIKQGARKAENELGIKSEIYRISEGQDRLMILKKALDEGFTHIIAVGFQNTVPVLTLADKYSNVKFTVIDSIVPPIYENVQSVSFKDHEGAFLVGMIAASLSKSKKIGFIGGIDNPTINNFAIGYFQGARYIRSDSQLVSDTIATSDGAGKDANPWNNPERAKILAKKQFNEKVDVIFAAAGGSSIGVLDAADEMGKYAIGVDTNQNHIHPGTVITSMVKRVDKAVYNALTLTFSARWKSGIKYLGLHDGALDYSVDQYNKDVITPEIIDKVEAAKDKIVNGTLDVETYAPY